MTSQRSSHLSLTTYGFVLFAVTCLASAKIAWARSMTGQVLSIETGNLISLSLSSGETRTVQLLGISPPESGWARIAKRHLHMLLAGKFVSVDYQTLTTNGHILGRVLHGGSDVNQQMLAAGMAQLKPDDPMTAETLSQYNRAQQQARIRRIGKWKKFQR